jgi:hypothetical protein
VELSDCPGDGPVNLNNEPVATLDERGGRTVGPRGGEPVLADRDGLDDCHISIWEAAVPHLVAEYRDVPVVEGNSPVVDRAPDGVPRLIRDPPVNGVRLNRSTSISSPTLPTLMIDSERSRPLSASAPGTAFG